MIKMTRYLTIFKRALVMEGVKSETVYVVLAADVQFAAAEKQHLRTRRSIAIPLARAQNLALSDELVRVCRLSELLNTEHSDLSIIIIKK